MRDPMTMGFATGVMLAHHRVDQDDRYADEKTLQAPNGGSR